jgi:hypothetical protein
MASKLGPMTTARIAVVDKLLAPHETKVKRMGLFARLQNWYFKSTRDRDWLVRHVPRADTRSLPYGAWCETLAQVIDFYFPDAAERPAGLDVASISPLFEVDLSPAAAFDHTERRIYAEKSEDYW